MIQRNNQKQYRCIEEVELGTIRVVDKVIPYNCADFGAELLDYVAGLNGYSEDLIVDVSTVEDGCSSCCATFVKITAMMKKRGKDLQVRGITGNLKERFKVLHLDGVLDLS